MKNTPDECYNRQQIIKACQELQEALIAEYEASQMEVESKVKKIAAHRQTLYAKNALSDLHIY